MFEFLSEGLADELVDVITLDIDPALVLGVVPPPGWDFLDPDDVLLLGPDAPFFDNYMEDGFINPPPWEVLDYLTFKSTDPQFDLTQTNSSFEIQVTANPTARLGQIEVWSGGSAQLVIGPVPEPSTALLLTLGMLGWWALTRRRRATAA